jgi:hypothetical protein
MFISDLVKEEGRPSLVVHARWEDNKPSAARLWLFTQRSDAATFAAKLPANEAEKFKLRVQELPEFSDETQVHLRGALAQSFVHCIAEFTRKPADAAVIELHQICFVWDPVPQAPGEAVICWYEPGDGFQVAIVHSQKQGRAVEQGFDWASDADKTKLGNRIDRWRMPTTATKATIIRGTAARLLGATGLIAETRRKTKSQAN